MRVRESIEIARPPEAVWSFVSDPANDPHWCDKVKSVHAAGERRWLIVHKPVPLRPAMELTLEQIELQAPERLVLREEDEASVFDVEYRLVPSGAGSRFTQTSEFEWKRLPRPLHGVFALGVRRDVRAQLAALKRHLEGSYG
ncbi:MAG TPA: SRPBCC family protein [Solirubrobacterales bacterium]|nr:SRPBCC family protein [Solirubrobacterales bacterium]